MGAQNNIDSDVLEIFGTNKIFVEAGGSDPEDQNNTLLLEKNEWVGLIVEPKKDFNIKYSKLRKNSILENYVLVSDDYSEDTIEGDFHHYMMGGVQNIHGLNWRPQKFPCIQLQKLLSKHNMKEIHFLSLDVEGYEKEVLNGIDFMKTFIHLIVVECHVKNGERESFDFLEEKGFKKIKQKAQHDYYFNIHSAFFPETK